MAPLPATAGALAGVATALRGGGQERTGERRAQPQDADAADTIVMVSSEQVHGPDLSDA